MNKNKERSSVTNEYLKDILKYHSKYETPLSARYESLLPKDMYYHSLI